MSIYNQDFNKISKNLLPPDKRNSVFISWLIAVMKPLQWLHDLVFIDYANGTDAIEYDNAFPYERYNRVVFNQKVYECLADCTGIGPVNVDYWVLVTEDFRGVRERVRYNGQKLRLEWILNKWFNNGSGFVQPDHEHPEIRSDYYVDTIDTDDNSFLVGEESPETSFVAYNSDIQEDWVGAGYDPETENLVVYFPLSEIPSDLNSIKGRQLKAITERYKLYGTTVKYEGY